MVALASALATRATETVRAIELPPPNIADYLIQALGPTFPSDHGGFYPSANGYFLTIKIPCGWPAGIPIHVDIYSPELNETYPFDEVRLSPALTTTFELFAPGTPTQPTLPGAGSPGSVVLKDYPPSVGITQWVRFHTLTAPVACSVYLLRSEARSDNGNSYRLRIGADDDANPNNTPPPNYDNPDGLPGTGDEIDIGVLQTAWLHVPNTPQCLELFEFVESGRAFVSFHNFEMDNTGSVTYLSPSGVVFTGTVSGNGVWNNGTATARGSGDRILNPKGGWWKITTCAGNDVHFIQEGQTDVIAYLRGAPPDGGGGGGAGGGPNNQPPSPFIVASTQGSKDVIQPNDTLTYQTAFTNTSNTFVPPLYPGTAISTVVVSKLPADTTFIGCSFDAPTTGTCVHVGGVVTYTINATQDGSGGSVGADGAIKPGASGRVTLVVQATPNIYGRVTHSVEVLYRDGFNQLFSAKASHVGTVPKYFVPLLFR